MNSFFFSLAMVCTASPTAETGTSTIRSTCSVSYQRRAMPAPISGLSWWSPTITVIGLPSTVPPKSSTAICAAVTEPCPVGVDAGPFMSVRTPILTMSSEIWAHAPGDASMAKANANAASTDRLRAETKPSSSFCDGPVSPVLAGRKRPACASCNYFVGRVNPLTPRPDLGRSGGKPDLAGGCGVVAGQLGGALPQPAVAEQADQGLDRWPEVAALAHQQIEALPQQRREIEPRRLGRGPRGDAAIGVAAADRGRQIPARQTGRLQPAQVLRARARARQQRIEQQLRAGARLPDGHLRAGGENVRQALQALRVARCQQQSLLAPCHPDQHRILQTRRGANRRDIGIAGGIRGERLTVEMDRRGDDLAALQTVDAAPGALIQGGEARAGLAQTPFQEVVLAAADDRRRFRDHHAGWPRHPGQHPEVEFMARKQPFARHLATRNSP